MLDERPDTADYTIVYFGFPTSFNNSRQSCNSLAHAPAQGQLTYPLSTRTSDPIVQLVEAAVLEHDRLENGKKNDLRQTMFDTKHTSDIS